MTQQRETRLMLPHLSTKAEEKKEDTGGGIVGVHEARKGLLKIMLEHNLKTKFSSTPIDPEEDGAGDSSSSSSSSAGAAAAATAAAGCAANNGDESRLEVDKPKSRPTMQSMLTSSERQYLESLLASGDASLMESASRRLKDPSIFPKDAVLELAQAVTDTMEGEEAAEGEAASGETTTRRTTATGDNNNKGEEDNSDAVGNVDNDFEQAPACPAAPARKASGVLIHRDSALQQELFRLYDRHQDRFKPSEVLRRMQQEHQQQGRGLDFVHSNSILESSNSIGTNTGGAATGAFSPTSLGTAGETTTTTTSGILASTYEDDDNDSIIAGADDVEDEIVKVPITPSQIQPKTPQGGSTCLHRFGDDDENNDGGSRVASPVEMDEAEDVAVVGPVMVDWHPFKDISSWLDGSQGVEVNGSGIPLSSTAAAAPGGGGVGGATDDHGGAAGAASSAGASTTTTTATTTMNTSCPQKQRAASASAATAAGFRILGTSANDVSCHPHVLSPPLMESLLEMVPDSVAGNTNNFWLKYSLVRDGNSLWNLLRQVRASTHTFLAIETSRGHVLGAFTGSAWRFSQGWYGGKDAFLWKMRKSRLETAAVPRSIVQRACQEAEIQVFPYRTGNVAVQYCSKECIMLGQGELLLSNNKQQQRGAKAKKPLGGKHYGHGLYLASDLRTGSTSTSETFGNPCLTDGNLRGERFDVANIEVWTLTPHDTIVQAEQSELATLFLEGGREYSVSNQRLNIVNILVGGLI